jgi:hypothetical protein
MSVQTASLNYSAHVWSPASWRDSGGFQGLLGGEIPLPHTETGFFAGARRMRARTRAGAPGGPPKTERPSARGRRPGGDAAAKLSSGGNNYTHKREYRLNIDILN